MLIMMLAKRMGRFFEFSRYVCNRNMRHFRLSNGKVLIPVWVTVRIVSIVTILLRVSMMFSHNRDMLTVTVAVLMAIG